MTTVVWREWYNESAVKKLIEMGTLPRNEIEVDGADELEGWELAELIVRQVNGEDPEYFRQGGSMVILEPEKHAGTYNITVEYEPTFYADRSDE